jgi:hypothetical protein
MVALTVAPAVEASASPTTYTTHPIAGFQSHVACLTPTRCVVGGYNIHGQADVVVVNGGVPGHVSLIPASQDVYGISCPNAAGCVALVRDKTDVGTELVTINAAGVTGHPVTYPDPNGAAIFAIACTSLRSCTLAGNNLTSTPNSIELATWNGARLTFHRIPGVAKSTFTVIEGVACVATTCDVVGYSNTHSLNVGISLIDHGGTAFKLHTVANDSLYGVSCISPARCYADGFNQAGGIFVVLTNGALTSSTPTVGVSYYGITCSGASCVAAGQESAVQPSTAFTWGAVVNFTNGTASTPIPVETSSKLYSVASKGPTVAVLGQAQKLGDVVGIG